MYYNKLTKYILLYIKLIFQFEKNIIVQLF